MESIERCICCQDQSNEEPFIIFIRPQFGSQFVMFHLLGFIKPMQHFNLNVFVYTPFKMLSKLQIRTLHALSFLIVDCGHIDLGFMVYLKRLLISRKYEQKQISRKEFYIRNLQNTCFKMIYNMFIFIKFEIFSNSRSGAIVEPFRENCS